MDCTQTFDINGNVVETLAEKLSIRKVSRDCSLEMSNFNKTFSHGRIYLADHPKKRGFVKTKILLLEIDLELESEYMHVYELAEKLNVEILGK